jgi:hypothetical protein
LALGFQFSADDELICIRSADADVAVGDPDLQRPGLGGIGKLDFGRLRFFSARCGEQHGRKRCGQ